MVRAHLVERQHDDLRTEYWIGVLEEYGLLPNYTLLDDPSTLDVSLTWIDPDTNDFESEPRSFGRAASQALREFAPGATFYARGLEIAIDAVDLGSRASSSAAGRAAPPAATASTSHRAAPRPVSTCPRCGSGRSPTPASGSTSSS